MVYVGCGTGSRLRSLFHAGLGAVAQANRQAIWTFRRGRVIVVRHCPEHGTDIEVEKNAPEPEPAWPAPRRPRGG